MGRSRERARDQRHGLAQGLSTTESIDIWWRTIWQALRLGASYLVDAGLRRWMSRWLRLPPGRAGGTVLGARAPLAVVFVQTRPCSISLNEIGERHRIMAFAADLYALVRKLKLGLHP